MKGGVGASYTTECHKDLKQLDKITLDLYDKKHNKTKKLDFVSYDDFCEYLREHDYGLKLFKKESEVRAESNQIKLFLNRMNVSFIRTYTCIASHEDGYIIRIQKVKANLFRNAKGDLKNSNVLRELKLDPYKNLEQIYTVTNEFLRSIHARDLYYGDIKCQNVFVGKNNGVIIGDYGSIINLDVSLNQYSYTFKTPCHSEFVKFWINGRGSKLAFVKKVNEYDHEIFSEKNLMLVLKKWETLNVLDRPDENDDDYDYERQCNDYDYRYYKFYARAFDWFHFGIAMIELITYLKDDELLAYIKWIFHYYCSAPMLSDLVLPFRIFKCILNGSNATRSPVRSQTID